MSHANGLSPFKGKIKGYLLPADHFKSQATEKISKVAEPIVSNKKAQIDVKKSFETEKIVDVTSALKSTNIKIENPDPRKGVSSFSISSVKLKKEATVKSFNKKIIVNDAEDSFTKEKFLELWKAYIVSKNLQGENNIAALLEMGKPELNEAFTIVLKTSNSLSQIEIKKEIPAILSYLGGKLNNYKIKFDIQIEEQKKQEYIFGRIEKYNHLMKINPEIEVLKTEFNLDL
tara:strand:+ start:204 stop:896 length:693 start_codon:yes stop_codon:yes gene_type:complete